MKRSTAILFILSLCVVSSLGQSNGTKNNAEPPADFARRLETAIPGLLKSSDVPGISVAVIRNGEIRWTRSFGVKNTETKEPVTDDTVFEAASLTKPVVAYAIFKLIDAGKLDLDTPLNKYLGDNYDVGDDKRLNLITARRVLSHTSGFPNWRNRDSKVLPINFEPGSKFSYSGEGFVYLAKVAEKITGTEIGLLVKQTVLDPLGMKNSSLDWEEQFLKTKVFGHDSLGIAEAQNVSMGVNAASSLHTTATDYAKFVIAVFEGKGLKPETRDLMLQPQVKVNEETSPAVSWGLGWGLQLTEAGKSFWHWGDNGSNKAYVVAMDKSGDGLVFFANGSNGLSFLDEMLEAGLGGTQPASAWLDYERYDSPSRSFFKAVIDQNAEIALREFNKKRKQDAGWKISERQMNRVGYTLLRLKRVSDAIRVFEQNTSDFRESANTWDSLAEGHMVNGANDLAIRYYKKSLALDPENKNAEEKIKELSESNQPEM